MVDIKEKEFIVLVTENDEPLGEAPKLASHHSKTPLHRAFSCYIFDQTGKFLITRRALSKKVWPGVWTNSVCGHPGPGESYQDAIERRSEQELGMQVKNIIKILEKYMYKTPEFNGIIENEFCPVFFAILESQPNRNPEEVEEYKWLKWDEYQKELVKNADKYSYWSKDQMKQLINSSDAEKYIANIIRQ